MLRRLDLLLGRRLTLSLIAAKICGFSLAAKAAPQSATKSSGPSFEVASIRLGHVATGRGVTTFGISISGSHVKISGTLIRFLADAYDVLNYQIVGAPGWANSLETHYYNIVAKVEGDAEPKRAQVKEMLQTLLADRFKLRLHRETQQRQVLALVVGKDGARIKESQPETLTSFTWRPGQSIWLSGTKLPISQLAIFLSNQMKQPVIDKTELKVLVRLRSALGCRRIRARRTGCLCGSPSLHLYSGSGATRPETRIAKGRDGGPGRRPCGKAHGKLAPPRRPDDPLVRF